MERGYIGEGGGGVGGEWGRGDSKGLKGIPATFLFLFMI